MSVAKLDDESPFIGRQEQMRWVERLVFSQRGSISPIVICGPFGVGKTAFAYRFLRTRMPHLRVVYVSCAPSGGFANVLRELERQIRPVYESEDFAVVLDEIQGIGTGDL